MNFGIWVLTDNRKVTTFTISEDFVVFFYKDYKFILTNIPKKYW